MFTFKYLLDVNVYVVCYHMTGIGNDSNSVAAIFILYHQISRIFAREFIWYNSWEDLFYSSYIFNDVHKMSRS